MRLDAPLTAIVVVVVVVVPRMQGELVSQYLTAAAAIKRRLHSRGGLPMARLLPTTCHPGSRGGCAGYSASCRRRSVMLSRRGSRLLLRFHKPLLLGNERKVSHSRMFQTRSLDSLFLSFSLGGGSILETTKIRHLSLYHHAPPKTRPHPMLRMSDDFTRFEKISLIYLRQLKLQAK